MEAVAKSSELTILYDPLCGWCYGAMPTFRALAAQPHVTVALLPTGLFAGRGARPMNTDFAAYAWSNDMRIRELTGQPFSEEYRARVLGQPGTSLDSGPAITALTAVAETAPDRELAVLEAIQAARFVEGRDVTSPDVLEMVLRDAGLTRAAERFSESELERVVAPRTARGRRLLEEVGARGVPTVATRAAKPRAVPSELLYGRLDDLIAYLSL